MVTYLNPCCTCEGLSALGQGHGLMHLGLETMDQIEEINYCV